MIDGSSHDWKANQYVLYRLGVASWSCFGGRAEGLEQLEEQWGDLYSLVSVEERLNLVNPIKKKNCLLCDQLFMLNIVCRQKCNVRDKNLQPFS